jgi:hypothetical protein
MKLDGLPGIQTLKTTRRKEKEGRLRGRHRHS